MQVQTGFELDADRLLMKVTPVPIAGCWIWTGAMAQGGYGSVWLKDRVVGAHRAAWRVWCGEIPTGFDVCHRCDVRLCLNPAHLFVGTREDNMQDAVKKGHTGHHVATLSYQQAQEIRASSARGVDLAAAYGVSENVICNIRAGRYYRRPHALRKAA